MSAAQLTPLLLILTGMAWLSAFILARAAMAGPNLGALSERAWIAFLLAVLGSVAVVLRYNTDTGFSLFPLGVGAFIFALTMLFVLLVPTVWVVLWVTGRLGESGKG